jgi:hypothetical protein
MQSQYRKFKRLHTISYIFAFRAYSVGILTPNVIEACSMEKKEGGESLYNGTHNFCGHSTEKIL